MDISWIDPAHPPVADVAGAVAVTEAARIVDSPYQLATAERVRRGHSARLGRRTGADGRRPATRTDRWSRLFGVAMPMRDNTHLGEVFVTVDPAWRRQGIGTRTVRHRESTGSGRPAGRWCWPDCWDGSAGIPFAKSVGLDRASEDVMRRQNLRTIDHDRVAGLAAEARRHSPDYDLVRLPGAVPDHLLDAVVTMTDAINDAPTDDLEIEDEVFSPDRIRAFDAARQAYGRRIYRLVARHRASGELAGHTLVAVPVSIPGRPGSWTPAWSGRTAAIGSGCCLKAEMLGWLRECRTSTAPAGHLERGVECPHDRDQRDSRLPG